MDVKMRKQDAKRKSKERQRLLQGGTERREGLCMRRRSWKRKRKGKKQTQKIMYVPAAKTRLAGITPALFVYNRHPTTQHHHHHYHLAMLQYLLHLQL
jgi:hypothetical protein